MRPGPGHTTGRSARSRSRNSGQRSIRSTTTNDRPQGGSANRGRGDACYIPPGHIPVKNDPGTEILWFSPTEELRTAEAAMMTNMQAMQGGSTP